MDDKKKLFFLIAVNSFETTDKELAQRNAENVVDNIETKEDLDFVLSLLTEEERAYVEAEL